jgi:hypothetical protein
MTHNEELEAKEKWDAAWHEAGHAVMILALGCPMAKINIFRNPRPCIELKSWFGNVGQCGPEVKGKANQAMIGLSGGITDYLREDKIYREENDDDVDNGWPDHEINAYEIADAIDYGEVGISPTDQEMIQIHPRWRIRTISRCLSILRANWRAIEGIAKEAHDNYRGQIYPTERYLAAFAGKLIKDAP